jgi:hypothetical protein
VTAPSASKIKTPNFSLQYPLSAKSPSTPRALIASVCSHVVAVDATARLLDEKEALCATIARRHAPRRPRSARSHVGAPAANQRLLDVGSNAVAQASVAASQTRASVGVAAWHQSSSARQLEARAALGDACCHAACSTSLVLVCGVTAPAAQVFHKMIRRCAEPFSAERGRAPNSNGQMARVIFGPPTPRRDNASRPPTEDAVCRSSRANTQDPSADDARSS